MLNYKLNIWRNYNPKNTTRSHKNLMSFIYIYIVKGSIKFIGEVVCEDENDVGMQCLPG